MNKNTMKTVKEVSKIAGVSVRTLHYYDEIGLLSPKSITEAGYRLYDEEELSKLQQILFFKEMDFDLKTVKYIMDNPNYDKVDVLVKQREILNLKRQRIDNLIKLIDKNLEGHEDMSFKEFNMSEVEKLQEKFKVEVEERWGKTKAYKESTSKTSKYNKNDWKNINEAGDVIFKEIAANMDKSPSSLEIQALIKKWQDYITKNFYNCTNDILLGLGEMYVLDERFTVNIDKFGKDLSQFINEGIKYYCRK